MKAKFAKAIARNIRVIAESTAHMAIIDSKVFPNGKPDSVYEARCTLFDRVEKAEHNIAALLQQPGVHQED